MGQTVVDLSSECFDDENPSGTYEVSVVLEDGTTVTKKLVVNEAIDYTPPVLEQEKLPILLIAINCFINSN